MMTDKEALYHAKQELSRAIYESELSVNSGLRKIASNKADWLSRLIYMAEQHLKLEGGNNAAV
jgi:hypothetical protein